MFEPMPDALCTICAKQWDHCDREACEERGRINKEIRKILGLKDDEVE